MARFGINPKNTLGVKIPILRAIAKDIGKNHELAILAWKSGIHEMRILACLIDDVKMVGIKQMDIWVKDFDSWDVCDQVCSNLFDKTDCAFSKAKEWAKDSREFVKRAGYVLMATLAVHQKKAADADFLKFFPLIKQGATDERNYVKKAVNWALRQIGKRNNYLKKEAIKLAEEIKDIGSPTARWIALDTLRELKKYDK